MKKYFLPNLNALRFFAASTVVFSHVDLYLWSNGLTSKLHYFFPFAHGNISVIFFFVLSGFLITYLLLIEKHETQKIHINSFYIKRILRIWPLYFIVLIVSIIFINNTSFFFWKGLTDNIAMNNHKSFNIITLLCISPNIALLNTYVLGYATPLWSLGVEEQFYLIWPWIVKRKNFLALLIILTITIYILNNNLIESFLNIISSEFSSEIDNSVSHILLKINKFFTFSFAFHIDSMSIGALGAYLVVNNSNSLNVIFSKNMQIFLYIILCVILIVPSLPYQFSSIIFMMIIINLACNTKTIFAINSVLLDKLGQISFGIYVYHCIMIPICAKLTLSFFKHSFIIELLICTLTLFLSVIVSAISYNTIEHFFLKFRPKEIILVEKPVADAVIIQ